MKEYQEKVMGLIEAHCDPGTELVIQMDRTFKIMSQKGFKRIFIDVIKAFILETGVFVGFFDVTEIKLVKL